MRLQELYKTAIEIGKENDPRGKAIIMRELEKVNKQYNELKDDKKTDFDQDKLFNPYVDTRILYGKDNIDIKTIIIGIDMEAGEILLADRLKEKGRKVDLVIAHHPEGYAYASFYQVMSMQADILNKFGVPINVAEGVMESRIKEVERRVLPANHTRSVDVARLLDIPFMCIHTPADNCVTTYLQNLFNQKSPYTVEEVIKILKEIPEYKDASVHNTGVKIIVGAEGRRCGKIFVDMTGGTEGSKEIFSKLSNTDVGTLICMHMSDDNRKEAEKNNMNVIIAGHIPSDTLGINLLLDELCKKEQLDIIGCSGFQRISGRKNQ
ncbi:NGG1p interacting factor NIF3 [Candidatus Desantisbacteria bacterium]|nr:NGG1p interacting factor NIF3 [Candidatus Desantisbacteria bacterium]